MITELQEKEIFVFGSNKPGHHIGGAAKQAQDDFGAEGGIGEGLTGHCYAFPTIDYYGSPMSPFDMIPGRNRLYATARALPEYTFLLTKVGCGIAGQNDEEVKQLFVDAPDNIVKPEGW